LLTLESNGIAHVAAVLADVALPTFEDDQKDGTGMKLDSVWKEIRAARDGDKTGDEEGGVTTSGCGLCETVEEDAG